MSEQIPLLKTLRQSPVWSDLEDCLSGSCCSCHHSLCSSSRVFLSFLSHVRHTLPQFSLLRTSFSQLFSLSYFPTFLRFCSAHLAHFLSGTAPGSIFYPALLCWLPCFFFFFLFYLTFYSMTYNIFIQIWALAEHWSLFCLFKFIDVFQGARAVPWTQWMLNTYLKKILFIYLAALGLSYGLRTFSCGMWALVPQPGIESGPPALGAWNFSHWTTRDVPHYMFVEWMNGWI